MESLVAQGGPKLLKMTLNFWSSYFHFPGLYGARDQTQDFVCNR